MRVVSWNLRFSRINKCFISFTFLLVLLFSNVSAENSGNTLNFSSGGDCLAGSSEGIPFAFWKNITIGGSDTIISIMGGASGSSCIFYDYSQSQFNESLSCCPEKFDCMPLFSDPTNLSKYSCQPSVPCGDIKFEISCNLAKEGALKSYNRYMGTSFNSLDKINENPVCTLNSNQCCITHSPSCKWDGSVCTFNLLTILSNIPWYNTGTDCNDSDLTCYLKGVVNNTCNDPVVSKRKYSVGYIALAGNGTSERYDPSIFNLPGYNYSDVCKNVTVISDCDASVQLSFFNYFNFLIVIFGILIFYVIFGRNKFRVDS